MKAITLMQPWATLVAIGAKKIETRSWKTKHRGPLAIHAGKRFPSTVHLQGGILIYEEPYRSFLNNAGYWNSCDLPLGKVVAVVDLLEVERIMGINVPGEPERSFGDYRFGRYMWHLEVLQYFPEPIEAKGAQRLWTWDYKICGDCEAVIPDDGAGCFYCEMEDGRWRTGDGV